MTCGSIHRLLAMSIPIFKRFGSRSADSRNEGSCSGAVNRSPGSGPAMTSSIRAASRTVRAIGPEVMSPPRGLELGEFDTRPRDGLTPTTPQQLEGIRIDPPPSVPSAIGHRQAATAAAEPPLDPPAVLPRLAIRFFFFVVYSFSICYDVIGAIEQRQRRLEIGLVTATGSRRAELLDDIRAVEELLVAFGATNRRPPGTLLN